MEFKALAEELKQSIDKACAIAGELLLLSHFPFSFVEKEEIFRLGGIIGEAFKLYLLANAISSFELPQEEKKYLLQKVQEAIETMEDIRKILEEREKIASENVHRFFNTTPLYYFQGGSHGT